MTSTLVETLVLKRHQRDEPVAILPEQVHQPQGRLPVSAAGLDEQGLDAAPRIVELGLSHQGILLDEREARKYYQHLLLLILQHSVGAGSYGKQLTIGHVSHP